MNGRRPPSGKPARPAPGKASPARKGGGPGPAAPAGGAHRVRIIGGQWKRTPLPVADRPGLRPTPDRVRETLFNWLGQDLDGWRCVDAFSGTGALGLEAASRGAARVLLVEREPALAAQIRAIADKLGATTVAVERGDGVAALRRQPAGSVDLVFLDPPFDAGLFEPALAASVAPLSAQGLIYLEAPEAWDDARLAPLGLSVWRHVRAGMVHAHLLRRLHNAPQQNPTTAPER